MKNLLKKLVGDKAGASAAEYALILAVVGAGIAVGLGTLGTNIQGAIDDTNEALTTTNDD